MEVKDEVKIIGINKKEKRPLIDKIIIIVFIIVAFIILLFLFSVALVASAFFFVAFSIYLIFVIIKRKKDKQGNTEEFNDTTIKVDDKTRNEKIDLNENSQLLNKNKIESEKEKEKIEEEEENNEMNKIEKEEIAEIEKEKIDEINERQLNLRKEKESENEKEIINDNLELVEKIGKLKSLTDEEIIKEKKKVQLFEDMNAMGTIMKGQILEEKKTNPENFYSMDEIVKNNKDDDIFALGVFSNLLESQGLVTAIEKQNNNEESKESAQTSLQFLINGMSNKPKYNLYFDFGKEKNAKLLNDEKERKKFHDKLRKKLSKEYNINEEDIIITFPRKGSYQITVIFKSEDFELNENDLLNKFNNDKELGKLKKIESGLILEGCKLSPSMLDYRGNNRDGGWAGEGEKRGGEEYIPPTGWIGYGLKVKDVYKDNVWLGMSNIKGEWCVAYHGVANGQSSKDVSRVTGLITKKGFKPSIWGKATDDEDLRHPGKTCGLGVYCSPDIEYAERYAGRTNLNDEIYKCVLMLRVNPEKIRQSSSFPKEYILEANPDEIRPYRILLKKYN